MINRDVKFGCKYFFLFVIIFYWYINFIYLKVYRYKIIYKLENFCL